MVHRGRVLTATPAENHVYNNFMELRFVYITAKDKKEAKKLAKAIVVDRLASCANIIGGVNSIYWWDGKIQDDSETVIIAKTKKSLVTKLIKRVKSLHSYSCPCIVSLPIECGNKDFLRWIEKETI